MSHYRDNYYGSILDPLHGDIKLSEIEKWCIAQSIFARLRSVKQNTFLYYVFPSANHTRFEHSIGVMHVAGKIFDSCKENYATGRKKNLKYNETISSFFDLETLGVDLEPLYFQELRLAALLHDIGHGPMSHLFDEFGISEEQFLKIVDATPLLEKYKAGFSELIKKDGKVEHEMLSCAFILMLIQTLKTVSEGDPHKFTGSTKDMIKQLSSERIVTMLEPTFQGFTDKLIDDKGNDYTNFFSRIVTAFPIDADRMDYLLRDSYFSGVTYGIYDVNRVFASFQAAVIEGKKVDLAYRESGLDSMLRFMQSRTHLYNQVYFHKTNRAANTMLSYATATRKGENYRILNTCSTFEDLKNFYTKNSDEFFLRSTVWDNMLDKGYEFDVFRDLLSRKLFKRVYETKIVLKGGKPDTGKQIKKLTKEINSKLKPLISDHIYATADHFKNDTFKDSTKNILIAKKNKSSRKYEFEQDWKKAGREFELSNLEIWMVRVYIRRTFHSPQQYKEICSRIKELPKDEITLL